jgi:hypothetical protein
VALKEMTLEEFHAACDAIEPDERGCRNYRGRRGKVDPEFRAKLLAARNKAQDARKQKWKTDPEYRARMLETLARRWR